MSRIAVLNRPIELSFLMAGLLFVMPSIDVISFHIFNGHLQWTPLLYNAFFAALNHQAERSLNVFVILSSILVGMPIKQPILKHFSIILSLLIWYELFFQLIHYAEKHILLHRASPSLLLNLHVNLAEFDAQNLVKVYADSCFPSGHAMILGYWHQMARKLFSEPWRKISMALSILMCLPRLIAGAHWLSDVIVGFALGSVAFFVIAKVIPSSEKSS